VARPPHFDDAPRRTDGGARCPPLAEVPAVSLFAQSGCTRLMLRSRATLAAFVVQASRTRWPGSGRTTRTSFGRPEPSRSVRAAACGQTSAILARPAGKGVRFSTWTDDGARRCKQQGEARLRRVDVPGRIHLQQRHRPRLHNVPAAVAHDRRQGHHRRQGRRASGPDRRSASGIRMICLRAVCAR
jgi:hypothetical protein